MPEPFDLVVRGATVVSPGRRERADIGVRDGRIAQVGGAMTGRDEIAADGLLALPGGVDAHVHLMYEALAGQLLEAGEIDEGEPGWVDDFWTGSLAAIGGGITTIGNMTFPLPGETPRDAVAREMAGAAPEAAVDWFLHPVLADPGAAAGGDIAALAAAGHTSVKIFLTMPQVAGDEPGLRAALAAARDAGSLTLLHCEAAGLLEQCGNELIAHGRGEVQNFPAARPVAAEDRCTM
jgi:dihydroorotase-like cyclic amidohydrolase